MISRTESIWVGILAFFVAGGFLGYYFGFDVGFERAVGGGDAPTTFEECVASGNAVMESYPRQCRSEDGTLFVEEIGNELQKRDLIRLDSPRPNEAIKSPLTVTGEARGNWYFEATFPIVLTNWDGLIIAEGFATAQDAWMTTEFVPFTAELIFDSPYSDGDPSFMRRGSLILQKDNPSGLPENDDALEIPVTFQ